MKESVASFIGRLFQSRDIAHLAHLRTKSYAQHKALNEYYDEILDFVDELAESHQGLSTSLLSIKIPEGVFVEPIAHLEDLREYINTNRSMFKESYEQNIIDEIQQLINQTLYKLSFLK